MDTVWVATIAALGAIGCPFFCLYAHRAHWWDQCLPSPINEGGGRVNPNDPDYAKKKGINPDLVRKKELRDEKHDERLDDMEGQYKLHRQKGGTPKRKRPRV
jgi:hypothetical protein